jgi:Meckel syndrome type 1 protein
VGQGGDACGHCERSKRWNLPFCCRVGPAMKGALHPPGQVLMHWRRGAGDAVCWREPSSRPGQAAGTEESAAGTEESAAQRKKPPPSPCPPFPPAAPPAGCAPSPQPPAAPSRRRRPPAAAAAPPQLPAASPGCPPLGAPLSERSEARSPAAKQEAKHCAGAGCTGCWSRAGKSVCMGGGVEPMQASVAPSSPIIATQGSLIASVLDAGGG